ncbi:hypothetical protein [Schlesneria sp.]|uniref:hypothetical protein n=1 Tax=Schlesneria sp. TaxID=2762018 RepID=UPI002F0B296D
MAKKMALNGNAGNPAEEFVPPDLSDEGGGGEQMEAEIADHAEAENVNQAGEPPEQTSGPVIPETVQMELTVPCFVGEIDPNRHGYVSARIDCTLTGEMGSTFRRVLLGCREQHLTYSYNGRQTHVESGSDLVRWLVEQVSDQMRE